jgi:hypothetical protein
MANPNLICDGAVRSGKPVDPGTSRARTEKNAPSGAFRIDI